MPATSAVVNYDLRKFPKLPVHVVTVDLSSPRVVVQPQVAHGGKGHTESFRSMLRRTRPVAAITGAFFDTRSKIPVGDIAINGELVNKGWVGAALCVSEMGEVRFVRRAYGAANGWQGYTDVLSGGPTLVRDGKVWLYPYIEGFRDSGLYSNGRRTAVGMTSTNKLLLVSINKPISLKRLALVMKTLGCLDAITLDGGSSAGLWYNGKLFSQPARKLTNMLAIHIVEPPTPVSTASGAGAGLRDY